MEVGAVKQAFNNEVILLKKKLNQAKIQIIHKLTRKAKTLTDKKVPEKLKVKYTKKAESAVNEVLIIKKIKARDIAKFTVTHKGQLNEYLNRPTVDQDKGCARLLLHKALQDKYKLIRERFSNISIKDLLMSRQERRKLKKEAREKQKNKKKDKNVTDPVQAKAEGDWDVENTNTDDSKLCPSDDDMASSADETGQDDDKNDDSEIDESADDMPVKPNTLLKMKASNGAIEGSNTESGDSNDEGKSENDSEETKSFTKPGHESGESNDSDEEVSAGKFVKLPSCLPTNNMVIDNKDALKKLTKLNQNNKSKNQIENKQRDNNKNKNLKNKILSKKFHKDIPEMPQENKVVDPFFITATGENYMSVAESRPPDEVKEVHKQGNRKYRRAVMFGHAVKTKPRRDGFRQETNSTRFNKVNDTRGSIDNNFNGFNKHGQSKLFNKSIDGSNSSSFKDRRNDVRKIADDEGKPEKLHPSWEAKKRQSGILPFQGKKTVFDEE